VAQLRAWLAFLCDLLTPESHIPWAGLFNFSGKIEKASVGSAQEQLEQLFLQHLFLIWFCGF
jgi:hypothetical protein